MKKILLIELFVLVLFLSGCSVEYVEEEPVDEPSRVYYFIGSSVTYGYATNGYSFVDMLSERLGADCHKEAVSGTTLSTVMSNSYVSRMEQNCNKDLEVDRFFIQLSANDVGKSNISFGDVSDSKDINTLDHKTTVGAIEYMVAYVKQTWDCEVTFYTCPYFNSAEYSEELIPLLMKVAEKWEIDVIDFYNYVDMDRLSESEMTAFLADSIHPNLAGYQWMTDVFVDRLK